MEPSEDENRLVSVQKSDGRTYVIVLEKLPVSGHDELSEMVQRFNHMAEEIQRQITELITAAEKNSSLLIILLMSSIRP